jgi:hypothetical protein
LSNKPGQWTFRHDLTKFRLEGRSRFFNELSEEERNKWDYNPTAYLLPGSFTKKENRFDFWGFYKKLENEIEWDRFEKINKFCQDSGFSYRTLESGGVHYYTETRGSVLINYIIFNEPEYWEVLKEANDEVTSLEKLLGKMKGKNFPMDEDRLIEIIQNLKSNYLLYADADYTRVVSVIDAG